MIETVTQWASQILHALIDLRAWLIENQIPIATFTAILALFRPWSWFEAFRSFRKQAPRIEFSVEEEPKIKGNGTDSVIRIANVGGSVAADVRLTWMRRSSCGMHPVPQPLMLDIGEKRLLRFTASSYDLVRRAQDRDRRLGWLIATYSEGGWRRRRVGRTILIAQNQQHEGHVSLDLRQLPRRSAREALPPLDTVARWLKVDERRQRRLQADLDRRFDEWLQESRIALTERGVRLDGDPEEAFHRLLGELGSRGWEWRYETGGRGYDMHAKKTWPPSSSMEIHFDAPNREDLAALVLATAIKEDEERTGTAQEASHDH